MSNSEAVKLPESVLNALVSTGLVSLDAHRANLSAVFFSKAKETPPIRDATLSL